MYICMCIYIYVCVCVCGVRFENISFCWWRNEYAQRCLPQQCKHNLMYVHMWFRNIGSVSYRGLWDSSYRICISSYLFVFWGILDSLCKASTLGTYLCSWSLILFPQCFCMGGTLYVITINFHFHTMLHQPLHSWINRAGVCLPHIIPTHTMVNNVCYPGKGCVDHVMWNNFGCRTLA